MVDGWYSLAMQHRSGPYGYPLGAHGQNAPTIFCDHIMDGFKSTLDDDNWRAANWVGVHFGIGRNGSISQYASIFDASWGNGTAADPSKYDRANPRLALLESQGRWIKPNAWGDYYLADWLFQSWLNKHSISIEHEGFPGDVWTPDMIESTIRVKKWCLEELAAYGMPMCVGLDMLVGHYQIDAVNRANCPGPNWPRTAIYAAIAGGGDDMIRLNGYGQWWEHKVFTDGAGTMQVKIDFPGVPADATWVELEVFLEPSSAGRLVIMDGDGAWAGIVGKPWGYRSVIRARVINRQLQFRIEGGGCIVQRMGILGYS